MASNPLPSPPSFPFVGHLFELDGQTPLQSLTQLCAKHGPIFRLSVLGQSTIVVSAQKYVNELCDESRFGKHVHSALVSLRPAVGDGLFTAYGDEHNHYSAGNKRLIASVKGWKINLQVCYDLRFPVWSRQQGDHEYDVLIYVANWPERRSTAWKTLLRARAIENQCYVIGVNRVGNDGHNVYHTGDTMIVDPMGAVLYHKADEEDVYTIALEKEPLLQVRERLPFWKDADGFEIYK